MHCPDRLRRTHSTDYRLSGGGFGGGAGAAAAGGSAAASGGGAGRGVEWTGAASSIVVAPVSPRNISKKPEIEMPWEPGGGWFGGGVGGA